jgi:alpha-tubulin suppressor-like RCC1 family protein
VLSSSTGNTVSYTAPASSFGRVVRITATSLQDATQKKTIFVSVNPIKASIAAGGSHSLALKPDGTVLSWGLNTWGQLGDSTNSNRASPVPVAYASGIVAVAAGSNFSLALLSNGIVVGWGLNVEGELGDGTFLNESTLVSVINTSNVIAISAGGNHSLALKSDGTVLSWGFNGFGQLGDGTQVDKNTATAVLNASDIVAIAAGNTHSMALKADGTILSWGNNSSGQLGVGSHNSPLMTPVKVSNATNIIAISAGTYHSLALKSNGSLMGWGSDEFGQLGKPSTLDRTYTPETISIDNNNAQISAGNDVSMVLKLNGSLFSWGTNSYGQLGIGSVSSGGVATATHVTDNIVSMSAGGYHSLALKPDGTMSSWGGNFSGQLGDGTTTNQSSPVAVLLGLNTIRLP